MLELHANAGMLSPEGRCATFDAAANGYVRGEGCRILVLKRLDAAEADGDRIWDVIRGSAVNQDGASPGLTVPNGAAQERVVAAALRRAGLQPVAAAACAHPSRPLVVDEIGYLPISQDGAVLFFQLINARHERASTVLTSNKGLEDWGGVLGDEVMAAALIDRLVHHGHIVNIRGNSYRMRDHQNLLQSGSDRRRKRAA